MKFFLISDSLDVCTGFKLAGIEGVVIKTKEEMMDNINKCLQDENVGIVLITESLAKLEHDKIYDLKLKYSRPLIVEIPNPGKPFELTNSITQYIRDAIGIKI